MLHVYSDGGLMKKNPSPYGGAWAWCHVDARTGVRLASKAGVVLPGDLGMRLVTNNVTELLAAVNGLLACPAGERVVLFTDNEVTVTRLRFASASLTNVPETVRLLLADARRRVWLEDVVLVKGHPSRRELSAGKTRKGQPVSSHNVFVDRECRRVMREHMLDSWTPTCLKIGGSRG